MTPLNSKEGVAGIIIMLGLVLVVQLLHKSDDDRRARDRHAATVEAPTAHKKAAATGTGASPTRNEARADDGSLRRAIDSRARDVPVTGSGVVIRLLADDNDGSPHQRILLRLREGGSLLIAHNLELAPRVEPLAAGDELEFAGEYVWNEKGGVVHWTHPDPRGRHRAGWIHRLAR